MEGILRFKHWHLFLIFILPGYLSHYLGLFTIAIFDLIVYSLWLYSIAALGYAVKNKKLPVIFTVSIILMPLLWIVTYFRIEVISLVTSVLFLSALALNLTIVTKAFRKVEANINLAWIVIGFLIPIIGVWYIQPVVNTERVEEQKQKIKTN